MNLQQLSIETLPAWARASVAANRIKKLAEEYTSELEVHNDFAAGKIDALTGHKIIRYMRSGKN